MKSNDDPTESSISSGAVSSKISEGTKGQSAQGEDDKKGTSVREKHASKWEAMYQEILLFKEKNGHTLVPNRHQQLGSWVSTQRRHYKVMKSGKKTPLSQTRIQKLEQIGFVWIAKNSKHLSWDDRFQQLVDYKRKHGNCLVPVGYSENIQLANWVSTQRQEYKLWKVGKLSRLDDDKVQRLNEFEFIFEPPRGGPRKKRQTKDNPDDGTGNIKHHQRKTKAKTHIKPDSPDAIRVPWIKMFREFIWRKDNKNDKDMSGTDEMEHWAATQTQEYACWMRDSSESELTQEQVNLLDSVGFGNNEHDTVFAKKPKIGITSDTPNEDYKTGYARKPRSDITSDTTNEDYKTGYARKPSSDNTSDTANNDNYKTHHNTKDCIDKASGPTANDKYKINFARRSRHFSDKTSDAAKALISLRKSHSKKENSNQKSRK